MGSREGQIRDTLNQLLRIYTATSSALEESVTLLQRELATLEASTSAYASANRDLNDLDQLPSIDRRSMKVIYRGSTCFLGDTLMLGVIEYLAQKVNEYVTYDELLSNVWHAQREASTVRSVVKEVKKRLILESMSELANAIDGRVFHHYGLIIDSKHRRNVTQ